MEAGEKVSDSSSTKERKKQEKESMMQLIRQ